MKRFDLEMADLVQTALVELAVEELSDLEDLPGKLDQIESDIGREALRYWQEESGKFLNTTRLRYQQSLSIYEDFAEGGTVVSMATEDKLVIDIEEGKPSFDMKPGLLKGAERRVIPMNKGTDMRILTKGTDDSKWQHPGFRGLHLAEATDEYINNTLLPKHLDELFK